MNVPNTTVSARGVSVGYRVGAEPRVVASGITAGLHAGELTCLLGPNGAGKSTLLRTLTGQQPALAGVVKVLGRQIDHYTPAELARSIGIVLTDRITVPDMTAEQVVETGRSPYTGFWGRLSADDRQITAEAMEAVGVTVLAKKAISDLSDGERQKVMIAKAIAQQTPVLFLDEPTAFLDYPSKVDTMMLLRDLAHTKNMTVFMSTHDIGLATEICDSAWLMDKEGNVVCDTPAALASAGRLEEVLRFRAG